MTPRGRWFVSPCPVMVKSEAGNSVITVRSCRGGLPENAEAFAHQRHLRVGSRPIFVRTREKYVQWAVRHDARVRLSSPSSNANAASTSSNARMVTSVVSMIAHGSPLPLRRMVISPTVGIASPVASYSHSAEQVAVFMRARISEASSSASSGESPNASAMYCRGRSEALAGSVARYAFQKSSIAASLGILIGAERHPCP